MGDAPQEPTVVFSFGLSSCLTWQVRHRMDKGTGPFQIVPGWVTYTHGTRDPDSTAAWQGAVPPGSQQGSNTGWSAPSSLGLGVWPLSPWECEQHYSVALCGPERIFPHFAHGLLWPSNPKGRLHCFWM